MTQPIALLFGVHAHQPVGNFPEVLDDAHRRCYRPFLHTLSRFPDFRFAVHFSGWLLDYLTTYYQEDMALLRDMVARGQVELFGAGDTEPVLAAIPARDRIAQVNALSVKLESRFGQRPSGAWLTERVWESTVIPALAECGISYVTVDDYHFLCAGKMVGELNGYFTTEEDGKRLDLFPISEALRYRLPFSPARDAVTYLESLAAQGTRRAAIYFDDIEKFGIWPETYEWVYERGWLEQFIRGVLASDKITTEHYRDYRAAVPTRGVVYLPTTSYIEMNEWTLPADAAHVYAGLLETSKTSGQFERQKAFLRGGIWKNFFSRYPESNWMHKRMLELSARLSALPTALKTPQMHNELYNAQANDAYWHGLFGGIYLPHLRRAVYRAIVHLESLLDKAQPRSTRLVVDLDFDGRDEIFIHNHTFQMVTALDGLAMIREFDAYALTHNLGDTLRRQNEHYYRKIHLGATAPAQHEEGIASAHDRVSFKHEITSQDLETDVYGKGMFLDSRLDASGRATPLVDYHWNSAAVSDNEIVFNLMLETGTVVKTLQLHAKSLSVSYQFSGTFGGGFATEINLAMPSCDGPAGRYLLNKKVLGGFGERQELDNIEALILEDEILGGQVRLKISPPTRLCAMPYFTVSQSEAGFEKIMQAVTLVLQWAPSDLQQSLTVDLTIVALGKTADCS